MRIYIDFDGPILEVSDRYYSAYKASLPKTCRPISKKLFWQLRRSGLTGKEILSKTCSASYEKFKKTYARLVESRKLLRKDKFQKGAKKTLGVLSNHDLCLITARNNHNNLLWQLKYLRIHDYFAKIITVGNSGEKNWKNKLSALKKQGHKNSIIIGDSAADIISGKKADIPAVAVSNGLRNTKQLKKLKPFKIVSGIEKIPSLVKNCTDHN